MLPPRRVQAYRRFVEWQAIAAAQHSGEQLPELARLKQQLLHELLPELTDTDSSEAAIGELQSLADAALSAAVSHKAPPGRLARALTLMNIAWFVGCVLLVLGLGSLVGTYVAALLFLIPLLAWEAIGHAASLYVIHAATKASPAAAPYVGLTGLLMLTACIGGSIFLHLERWFKSNEPAAALMGGFTLLWGAIAVRLQAPLLGTLTVWWAMSALGFSIFVFPFLTVVGFRNGMKAPFFAALSLILLFLPFKVAPEALPTPAFLRPFETGVWLWCTLVLNLANLIQAHQRWYRSSGHGIPNDVWAQLSFHVKLHHFLRTACRCLLSQVPAVTCIGCTLACGIVLDVEQCRAVGAVFGFLWFASKLCECDWGKVGFGWGALVFGSVLWGLAYAVHTWPEAFMLASWSSGKGSVV
ncbi:hypothetical protein D9Q98_005812 [Chlorella vulgaris]|uniref:Uncharacterized protein n=1 Tax=Chlorella vulgaris TaxID=3077 RepID=A0A9D4Z0P8_CHLVU|nr:hypothetical protein D9Q98_005812 [Chlorella vulgaris]